VRSADACFLKTRNVIVGSSAQVLAAAREKAAALGWRPEVVTAELQGEARDAARLLARKAVAARDEMKQGERRCLLSGGETTVVVHGTGKGGRNQELALAFALEIAGMTTLHAADRAQRGLSHDQEERDASRDLTLPDIHVQAHPFLPYL
jgi:hydroxypyruvate reductase